MVKTITNYKSCIKPCIRHLDTRGKDIIVRGWIVRPSNTRIYEMVPGEGGSEAGVATTTTSVKVNKYSNVGSR